MLVTERTETLKLMDELETLVMKEGWPVPCTGLYVVHHERLFAVMDRLRASLQDDLDERFLQVFGELRDAQQYTSEAEQKQETILIGKGTKA